MIEKTNHIITFFFATFLSFTIFFAIPVLQLNGQFPQVDTQIIFLHGICSILFFFQAIKIIVNKNEILKLNNNLIIIPFLIALISIISSILSDLPILSFSGSSQIGQGVFWYFDLAIMTMAFSQITKYRMVKISMFTILSLITLVVTLFTYFPFFKGIPISFYYFTQSFK